MSVWLETVFATPTSGAWHNKKKKPPTASSTPYKLWLGVDLRKRTDPAGPTCLGDMEITHACHRTPNKHALQTDFICLLYNRGGFLGNRISCLKTPAEPNLKMGGFLGGGGGLRRFFATRGHCPQEGHPGPLKTPRPQ